MRKRSERSLNGGKVFYRGSHGFSGWSGSEGIDNKDTEAQSFFTEVNEANEGLKGKGDDFYMRKRSERSLNGGEVFYRGISDLRGSERSNGLNRIFSSRQSGSLPVAVRDCQ
jgi:hypothetical protein